MRFSTNHIFYFLITFSFLFLSCGGDSRQLKKAEYFHSNKQYAEAIEICNQLFEKKSDSLKAAFNIGARCITEQFLQGMIGHNNEKQLSRLISNAYFADGNLNNSGIPDGAISKSDFEINTYSLGGFYIDSTSDFFVYATAIGPKGGWSGHQHFTFKVVRENNNFVIMPPPQKNNYWLTNYNAKRVLGYSSKNYVDSWWADSSY